MSAACPSPETLVLWLDGGLTDPAAGEVARHVTSCDRCAQLVEQSAAVDVLLAEELARPPRARSRAWLPLTAAALLLIGLLISQIQPAPTLSSEEIAAQTHLPLPAGAPRVAAVTGGAQLRGPSAESSHAAVPNELLRAGDRVATGPGQRAKLSLASDADLVLNENSSLRLGSLGEGVVEVSLEHGELLATAGRALQISTPEGPVAVEAGEIVVRAAGDQTTVTVLRGHGRMKGSALERGEEASVRAKSLLKVRKTDRTVDVRWASAVRSVFYEDDFSAPGFSVAWRLSEGASESISGGRPVLALAARAAERKGYSYARFGRDLPLDDPVVFETEVRISRDVRSGRAQIVLPMTGPDGPSNLRWSISHDEDLLEAHGDVAGRKHATLWKARSNAADGEWHRLRMVLSKTDVVLERDGVRLAQVPHGLAPAQKASLVLGSLAKPKGAESFDCWFSGVRILRQTFD
jgi:ferric-dicitrate binding protein FerR (iron transport regulator)